MVQVVQVVQLEAQVEEQQRSLVKMDMQELPDKVKQEETQPQQMEELPAAADVQM